MWSSASGDETVAYVESRSKVLRMVAISAGFAVLGAGWVWSGGPDSGPWSGPITMTVMILGLLLGLVGLAYFAPRLVGEPRVLLSLDDDGFDDQASLMSAGRVQWAEVTELELIRLYGNDMVAIKVRDADRLQRTRGRLGTLVAAANRKWADVSIADSTLSVPAADVFEQMHARWERSAGEAPPGQAV